MIEYTVQILRKLLALLTVTGALTQASAYQPTETNNSQFPWYAALVSSAACFREDLYLNDNALIMIENHPDGDSRLSCGYCLAEIYLPDVHHLKAYYMDSPENGIGEIASMSTICRHVGAAFAVNGDYYVNQGVTAVRDGIPLNSCVSAYDLCVLYDDGRMNTYRASELRTQADVSEALQDAWQAWSFGPVLLNDDGSKIPDFSARAIEYLTREHPRTAIGYFAPGHYCLLIVPGYHTNRSGATLEQLSAFFTEIGCTKAYNLDGGASAHMWFHGSEICYSSESRALSDVLYIEDHSGGGAP